MTSKKLLLAGLIAALGLVSSVQAGVITVRPTNVTVHNVGNFAQTVDPSLIVSTGNGHTELAPRAEPYVLKIDVLINFSNPVGAEVGFGNVDFNIDIEGATRNVQRPNWRVDATQVDVDGELLNKWADGTDLGTANDLKHIVMGLDPRNFGPDGVDPRRTIGVSPFNNPANTNYDGDYAGAIYVDIAGLAGSKGSVTINALAGSTFDANGNLVSGATLDGQTLTFEVTPIPEPSTLALLGLGGALLVLARKRR